MYATTGCTANQQFTGAAAVRASYQADSKGHDQLLVSGCQRVHRRWSIQQQRSIAA